MSYGASSFYLSNKTRYPLFFRTIPSERSQGYARLAVLQYFKWNRIAILTEKEPYYEAVSIIAPLEFNSAYIFKCYTGQYSFIITIIIIFPFFVFVWFFLVSLPDSYFMLSSGSYFYVM